MSEGGPPAKIARDRILGQYGNPAAIDRLRHDEPVGRDRPVRPAQLSRLERDLVVGRGPVFGFLGQLWATGLHGCDLIASFVVRVSRPKLWCRSFRGRSLRGDEGQAARGPTGRTSFIRAALIRTWWRQRRRSDSRRSNTERSFHVSVGWGPASPTRTGAACSRSSATVRIHATGGGSGLLGGACLVRRRGDAFLVARSARTGSACRCRCDRGWRGRGRPGRGRFRGDRVGGWSLVERSRRSSPRCVRRGPDLAVSVASGARLCRPEGRS